jgi:NTP pyrophosphatase (non-canonical NTP hydrolase)
MNDLDRYQEQARATAAMDLPASVHRATMGLGIAGEAGEVADLVKKEIGHGHPPDPIRILKELGDVLWYVAMVADAYGWTLSDVAGHNIAKLRERYPDGFTTADSLARRDAS